MKSKLTIGEAMPPSRSFDEPARSNKLGRTEEEVAKDILAWLESLKSIVKR